MSQTLTLLSIIANSTFNFVTDILKYLIDSVTFVWCYTLIVSFSLIYIIIDSLIEDLKKDQEETPPPC